MKKNVALALSSGGARGLAHLGVIQELQSRGYCITSVAGASIGSLMGAVCAMNKTDLFVDFVNSFGNEDWISLLDLTISSRGFIKAEKVFQKIAEVLPDMPIEKMDMPLAIIASDIISGKEKVITEGSFYQAVRASIAIPAVITSVRNDNQILVDGGVVNPVPINHLHRQPDDIVVAVNLNAYPNEELPETVEEKTEIETMPDNKNLLEKAHEKIKNLAAVRDNLFDALLEKLSQNKGERGYTAIIQRVTDIMVQRLAALSIELNKPDIVIDVPLDSAGVFEFNKAQYLIELGHKLAADAISEYEHYSFE